MRKTNPNIQIVPQNRPVAGERLDSWKEIARYLRRDVRTVQRWEKNDALPVYRKSKGQKSGPVYAFTSEIDAWLRKNPPSYAEKESGPRSTSQTAWRTGRVFWPITILFILAAGGVVTWFLFFRQSSNPSPHVWQLTSRLGMEQFPALSPDGKWIAFTWDGPNQNNPNLDIYLKSVDGGEPRQLTKDPARDFYPVWSPDGNRIAFVRQVPGEPKVESLTMSMLGGDERPFYQFPLPPQHSRYWPPACYTLDGKWIIAPYPPEALALISPETGEARPLTEPGAGSGDCCPAISPDGRNLAFLRASPGRIWNLYIQALNTDYSPAGLPAQKTSEPNGVKNPMWKDDREVLYITQSEGETILWRAPVDDFLSASRVESLGPIGLNWTISAQQRDRLAYQSNRDDIDIWRIELTGEKRYSRMPCSSSKGDQSPQISPDGAKVAFLSSREKGGRVWVSALDGTNAIDLAQTIGPRPGIARWSPEGDQIAFECSPDADNDDICVVPSGGGPILRVTSDPGRDYYPSWSLDGKWIYVTSDREGSFQIWKVPSDGTEQGAVKITQDGGFAAQESEDGYIYFARDWIKSTIWRIASGGGEEIQFGTFSNLGQPFGFAVGSEGIYYASDDDEFGFKLWLCRFSTGESELIKRINMQRYGALSISPDEGWLLFSAAEQGSSDLWMVENFR